MITLKQPIFGLAVGETYEGPNEQWAVEQGYATMVGFSGETGNFTGATFTHGPEAPVSDFHATGTDDAVMPAPDLSMANPPGSVPFFPVVVEPAARGTADGVFPPIDPATALGSEPPA